MLREIPSKKVRQIENEPFRRWFCDQYFDLIVWEDRIGNPLGFQLCYEVSASQKAITWDSEYGFSHNYVDNGEDSPYLKGTPILIPGAPKTFNKKEITKKFIDNSRNIGQELVDLIVNKILNFPDDNPSNDIRFFQKSGLD